MEPEPQSADKTPSGSDGIDLQVERANADEVTILLRGQLRFDTADDVRQRIEKLLERTRAPRLVVDCARVDFIDSQALALLLAMSRRCRDNGGELRLRNPQPMVRKLLELTKLESLFTIYQTPPTSPADTATGLTPRVPVRPFNPTSQD